MGSRADLQELLTTLLGSDNVYYQPPSNKTMNYPAIVFKLSDITTIFANDAVYRKLKSYEVTVIDKQKDSEVIDRLLELKHCEFDRCFTFDNLNHYVFKLYY